MSARDVFCQNLTLTILLLEWCNLNNSQAELSRADLLLTRFGKLIDRDGPNEIVPLSQTDQSMSKIISGILAGHLDTNGMSIVSVGFAWSNLLPMCVLLLFVSSHLFHLQVRGNYRFYSVISMFSSMFYSVRHPSGTWQFSPSIVSFISLGPFEVENEANGRRFSPFSASGHSPSPSPAPFSFSASPMKAMWLSLTADADVIVFWTMIRSLFMVRSSVSVFHVYWCSWPIHWLFDVYNWKQPSVTPIPMII